MKAQMAMNGVAVTVTAEWALWGKDEARDRGYRLLQYSDGPVSGEVFEQVITRYAPGTPRSLPVVTIGWFRLSDGQAYLALAILMRGGHFDEAGREVVLTSFYGMPFMQLAAGAISYQAIYERFRGIRLPPAEGRSPIVAEFAVEEPALRVGELAMQAAALLLTGRPVCILGADQVDLGDRLRFLDDVASVLPYGMRSQLSASTWVSSAQRQHHLRLFFSSARGREDDHVILWGEPDKSPSGGRLSEDYLAWLDADAPRRAAQLAAQTEETGFGSQDVRRALDRLGATRHPPTASRPPEPDWPGRHYEDVETLTPAASTVKALISRLLARSDRADWVNRAVQDAVRRGLLVFNPPEEMTQGRKERVEVGIANLASLRNALAAGLRGRGEPHFEEIPTTAHMSVELYGGESFDITPHSRQEQVLIDHVARWEFDVRPLRAGLQTLSLRVWMRVALAGLAEIDGGDNSVRVLDREIRVRVNVSYGTRRFLAANWQWLIGTAMLLGGALGAWIALFH